MGCLLLLILGYISIDSDDFDVNGVLAARNLQSLFDNGNRPGTARHIHSRHRYGADLVKGEYLRKFLGIFVKTVIQLRTINYQDFPGRRLLWKSPCA